MRREDFSSFVRKDEKDVRATWIFRSMKVILKLKTEVEDFYRSYEGMSVEDIETYFKNLPSWMAKEEKGYAVGNFHCCMHLHAGPVHHQLVTGIKLPVDRTKEEETDEYEYVYGGGFSSLNEEEIQFLNDNGYIVVNGPEGPECRLA